MADGETRQKIKNLRDILVGKIPDPKAQVDQITTALIYKFMDDMDQQSIALGGKATFFSGEYEKFAWPRIMDRSLSGYERLQRYSEALESMSSNPNLPALFVTVFKDAFLPYRDPETLNLFLKGVDEFDYDHSERMGDAFEELLAIMGAQGDAGQFRTPRHIIDFIVKAVDPGKNDRILDPACGTAGFLISAYKHILSKHQGDDALTPDERKQLADNIVGYDISPEMVRLSLVNMYLHQFPDPHVVEYDTLTNDARWEDRFDVILANPPFMTPRGGIRPHNRFAVQANRAEVLFVDYIMEHLSPEGRAGIIVPEGIIFQSSNAYKQLRKMFVDDNYLYAVVSLPAGVFNPYAGVKTSILLLDRKRAKQSENILFVEVEHDGFDLGAQRNSINKNDLPNVNNIISLFKEQKLSSIPSPINYLLIHKSKINEGNDFVLSMGRYVKQYSRENIEWPLVSLGDEDLFSIQSGGTPSTKVKDYWNGEIRWATLVDLPQENFITNIKDTERKITLSGLENSSAKLLPLHSVVVSTRATIGRIAINQIELATNQGFKNIIIQDIKRVNYRFLAYMLTSMVDRMNQLGTGGTYKEISKSNFSTLELPLPPLEIQQEIVAEIEGYEKIIAGARQVVENYYPRIPIDPDWPLVELGDICQTEYGHNESAKNEGDSRFIRITDIDQNGLLRNNSVKFINLSDESKPYLLKKGDVVVARTGATYGKTLFFNEDIQAIFAGYLIRIHFDKEKIINKYFWCFAQGDSYKSQKKLLVTGGGQPQFNANAIKKIRIPLPDISAQKEIIKKIEDELQLIDSNKTLISKFEKKIEDRIARVWGSYTAK